MPSPSGNPVDLVALAALTLILLVTTVRLIRRARSEPTRARLLVGNALVLLTLATAALGAAETYMRYLYDGTTWHAGFRVTRAWFARHDQRNSWNWRDIEYVAERTPGVGRIAFIGDSFTHGYGVANPEDRFADRVRARLAERHPGRYDVWCVGQIGANTGEEAATLAQFVENGVIDHAVLCYALNDIEDLWPKATRDTDLAGGDDPPALIGRLFALDFVWRQAAYLGNEAGQSYFDRLASTYADTGLWSRQRARFSRVAELCRRHRVRLDVVLFPAYSHWGPEYPFGAIHEQVAGAFAAEGARVLDLRSAYEGMDGAELRVGLFDAHPNERAHAIAADAIDAALLSDR